MQLVLSLVVPVKGHLKAPAYKGIVNKCFRLVAAVWRATTYGCEDQLSIYFWLYSVALPPVTCFHVVFFVFKFVFFSGIEFLSTDDTSKYETHRLLSHPELFVISSTACSQMFSRALMLIFYPIRTNLWTDVEIFLPHIHCAITLPAEQVLSPLYRFSISHPLSSLFFSFSFLDFLLEWCSEGRAG